MPSSLRKQGEQLYRTFSELARRYQFRDREEICCHGISVSQCYTLSALGSRGTMTMSDLADHLGLRVSTVTRVVDGLVEQRMVKRIADADDRRVCRVLLASKGRTLIERIETEMTDVHEAVLKSIAPKSRQAVITAMQRLLAAFDERDGSCRRTD